MLLVILLGEAGRHSRSSLPIRLFFPFLPAPLNDRLTLIECDPMGRPLASPGELAGAAVTPPDLPTQGSCLLSPTIPTSRSRKNSAPHLSRVIAAKVATARLVSPTQISSCELAAPISVAWREAALQRVRMAPKRTAGLGERSSTFRTARGAGGARADGRAAYRGEQVPAQNPKGGDRDGDAGASGSDDAFGVQMCPSW